jgi:hypothetical protein
MMEMKKVLPVVLVASITGEVCLPVRHSDTLVPQQHIETQSTRARRNYHVACFREWWCRWAGGLV